MMPRSIDVSEFVKDLDLRIVNQEKITDLGRILFPSIIRAGIEIVTLKPSQYLGERIVV